MYEGLVDHFRGACISGVPRELAPDTSVARPKSASGSTGTAALGTILPSSFRIPTGLCGQASKSSCSRNCHFLYRYNVMVPKWYAAIRSRSRRSYVITTGPSLYNMNVPTSNNRLAG